MQKKQIPLIESLRGTACLIVMLAHILASDSVYGMYANGCGKIGVWCFLLISGFLAMRSMEGTKNSISKKWTTWLLSYYKNKLFRLYPLYIIALLLGLWIGFLPTFPDLIQHLFCLEGIGHFWYMPVIIKFYVFLPISYLLYDILAKHWFLVLHILAALVCGIVFPFTFYTENSIQLRWYLPVFIIGMVTYWIYKGILNNTSISSLIYSGSAIVDILVMLSFTPLMREILWNLKPNSWLQNKYLLYAILWGLLLLSLSKSKLLKWFERPHKCLEWVSKYSYEMYLFHYLFLFWFNNRISNTIIRGGVVLLSSAVCSMVIKYIFTSFPQRRDS